MSQDSLQELAAKCEQARADVEQARADKERTHTAHEEAAAKYDQTRSSAVALLQELAARTASIIGENGVVAVVQAPPAKKQKQAVAAKVATGVKPGKQTPLKEVVRGILRRFPHGGELKDIVPVVTKMINDGEYQSKAKQPYTAIINQALFQLKEDGAIVVTKTQDNGEGRRRHVYSVNNP